jgi:hypothetical protein
MTKALWGSLEKNMVLTARAENYIKRELKNQFYTVTPTFVHLRSKKKTDEGAEYLKIPVFEGGSSKAKFYPRTGGVKMQHTDPVSHAHYQWAFALEPIVMYHQDLQKIRGKAALFREADVQTKHAGWRLQDKLANALFGTVDADETSFAIHSLYDAIPLDPTSSGAFGGLNGAAGSQEYWRNKAATTAVFSTGGIAKMRALANDCGKTKGVGRPTIIVTTQYIHQEYEALASAKHEVKALITQSATVKQYADLGFDALSFRGIPVVFDPYCVDSVGDGSGNHPMLMLNDECIQLVEMEGGCFTIFDFESGLLSGIVGRGTGMRYEAQLAVSCRAGLGRGVFTLS